MNTIVLILVVLIFPAIWAVTSFIGDRRAESREEKANENLKSRLH